MTPTLFDLPKIDVDALETAEEKAVASLLNERVGAESAMQVSEVARWCGISPRTAQRVVHHLIDEHGAPIGTSMRDPHGWYLARTTEELEPVLKLHKARALSVLSTMAKLSGTSRNAVIAKIQTELMEEDGPEERADAA